MPQPAKPQNSRPGSTPLSRRRLLAGAGGAVAAGALFSRAGFASAAGQRSAAGRWFATSAADKPTLSQWYHGYGEEGVEDAVRRFAADYPDANVEVQWFPADYDTTVAAALLTDDGPDVFEIGNGPNIDMITTGQVLPLDGILGDAESDFNERLIKRLTYDGHLWAVPQIIDMFFLVYRKSWLADAGIDPPATVDDLIAAAAKLTTGDHSGLFLGNDGGVGTVGRHGPVVGRRRLPHRRQPVRLRQRRRVRLVRQAQRAVPERLVAARRADRLERPRRVHQRAHRHPAHRAVDVPGDPGVGDRRRLRHDAVAGAQLDGRRSVAARSARSRRR